MAPPPKALDPRVRPDPRELPHDARGSANAGSFCVVIGSDPAPREAIAVLEHATHQLTQREREERERTAREAAYLRERG